jgi:hypothetical protein
MATVARSPVPQWWRSGNVCCWMVANAGAWFLLRWNFETDAKLGHMYHFVQELRLQWNKWAASNVMMTPRLVCVTQGTLIIELPSYYPNIHCFALHEPMQTCYFSCSHNSTCKHSFSSFVRYTVYRNLCHTKHCVQDCEFVIIITLFIVIYIMEVVLCKSVVSTCL